MYVTAKNYIFYINRPSFADLDQPKGNEKPLTISHIEPACDLVELQKNERKRSVKEFVKDVEICRIIDKEILAGRTYAQLTDQEKKRVASQLSRRLPYCPLKQIYRCLAIQVSA
jgi:hypothetical protein